MPTAVVYVHGLWLSGLEGGLLRRRLASELGAQSAVFSYPSVRAGIAANAQALAKFLKRLSANSVHLVGHSLGGLVICKMFELDAYASMPPGRIVLLGSPLCGCRSAHRLARWPLGRKIMGQGVGEALLAPRAAEQSWSGSRDLGVIAGDLAFGLGRVLGRPDGPGDGTILVEETRLAGATDHVVVKVSHTGMIYSREVARQTAGFLRSGRFQREASRSSCCK